MLHQCTFAASYVCVCVCVFCMIRSTPATLLRRAQQPSRLRARLYQAHSHHPVLMHTERAKMPADTSETIFVSAGTARTRFACESEHFLRCVVHSVLCRVGTRRQCRMTARLRYGLANSSLRSMLSGVWQRFIDRHLVASLPSSAGGGSSTIWCPWRAIPPAPLPLDGLLSHQKYGNRISDNYGGDVIRNGGQPSPCGANYQLYGALWTGPPASRRPRLLLDNLHAAVACRVTAARRILSC